MFGYSGAYYNNNGENMSASIQQDSTYTFKWDKKDPEAVITALGEVIDFVERFRDGWGGVEFKTSDGECTMKVQGEKIVVHPKPDQELDD